MSLEYEIERLKTLRTEAGLGMLSQGLYSPGDLVSSTPIPGTRMGGMPDPCYGGHLLGEGMTPAAARYLGTLHNYFPIMAEAIPATADPQGDTAYLQMIQKIAEKHGWNVCEDALGNWIDAHMVDVTAEEASNIQKAALAHADEGTEIIRRLEGMLAKAKAERDEFKAALHATIEEASKSFQRLNGILQTSAGEELIRRAERVMKALDDARQEAGKAQARVRELEVVARTFYTAEGPVAYPTIEEVIQLRQEAARRLAAIDAAKAGEPPMPPIDGDPWDVDIKGLAAWGRQGWDSAAALRVEVATLQQHVQALGAPVYRAVEGERERLCRKFTSTPYNLKIHVPGSIEVVSLTFETALRHASVEPVKEAADAHPSF